MRLLAAVSGNAPDKQMRPAGGNNGHLRLPGVDPPLWQRFNDGSFFYQAKRQSLVWRVTAYLLCATMLWIGGLDHDRQNILVGASPLIVGVSYHDIKIVFDVPARLSRNGRGRSFSLVER